MAWGNFLLVGDMGQQLDLSEQAEELGRLRRSIARRRAKDLDQDGRIAALAEENLNLKVGLAGLVHMLVARGMLETGDIANLVHALDCADPGSETECRPHAATSGDGPAVGGTGLLARVGSGDGRATTPGGGGALAATGAEAAAAARGGRERRG